MIYDKLVVALLSALATERGETTNATIARYLVTHASELGDVTVRGVATACNVGMGSVSRFCRDMGFAGFDELRQAVVASAPSFELAPGALGEPNARDAHAKLVGDSLRQVTRTVDERMLHALVSDLIAYDKVFVCGMLKAQAAAVDLQVDLLMLGKYAQTCVNYAEQLEHIATVGRDELVVVFSYTGSYFDAHDLTRALARLDRPRIWMVAGSARSQPGYVYGCLTFESGQSQLTHPFQLEMAASLITQEYARCI